jgi:tetratricopeptide (TPR) repeat protein
VTAPNEHITVTHYSRHDVLRILRIRLKQLSSWERSGLISQSDTYSFQDLVQLRKLRDLRAMRLSVANIRASIHAMRQVSGVANPLLEAGAVRNGTRLAFRLSGAMMEPIARQFVFDFDFQRHSQLAEVSSAASHQAARESRVQGLFFEAVRTEERGKTQEAVALYESILELDSSHAPACINLGTIQYNQRHFIVAEALYRRATAADPKYALAFFDLGNVLDELQRLPEAIEAYATAIRLVPHYGDAHYNVALAHLHQTRSRWSLVKPCPHSGAQDSRAGKIIHCSSRHIGPARLPFAPYPNRAQAPSRSQATPSHVEHFHFYSA